MLITTDGLHAREAQLQKQISESFTTACVIGAALDRILDGRGFLTLTFDLADTPPIVISGIEIKQMESYSTALMDMLIDHGKQYLNTAALESDLRTVRAHLKSLGEGFEPLPGGAVPG